MGPLKEKSPRLRVGKFDDRFVGVAGHARRGRYASLN
jgi:hypothetical protein